MPLTMRSHSCNTYAFSKLLYRIADFDMFKSSAKSFIYANLLAKLCELVLFGSPKEGGLGLVHFKTRAKASLIATFLQTAINPKFKQILYHNALYRHYVLSEPMVVPAIPGNFSDDFFPTIRSAIAELGDLEDILIGKLYEYLVRDITRAPRALGAENDDPSHMDRPLRPIRCELNSPEVNWERSWRRARLRGLSPDLLSFILKLLWLITPTRERLHHILPNLYNSPNCTLCGDDRTRVPESLAHALGTCEV